MPDDFSIMDMVNFFSKDKKMRVIIMDNEEEEE